MFSDLTGSCNQYHCTPRPVVKPAKASSFPWASQALQTPPLNKVPSPSIAWALCHQFPGLCLLPCQCQLCQATVHPQHACAVWVPPPGLHILMSPRPALAQFLTHSRKRKDTCGVPLACLTPRASVQHMASGQPFLRKSVQVCCYPPPQHSVELPLPEAG